MKTWEHGADFLTSLKNDAEVTARIPVSDLEAMFDLAYHFKHVDTIFERVFGR
jgi:adenylosuccinate lyase